EEAQRTYGIELRPWDALDDLDGVILAVPHAEYLERLEHIVGAVRQGGVFIDVKSLIDATQLRTDLRYWSL
ncbi:MAG: hypothetical protein WBG86_09425, partial [Polyangiales bacterium]